MIRIDDTVASEAARPRMAIPLPALLRKQRKQWLRAFKRCREKLSKKTVHEIRVQSRRLISVLNLARIVLRQQDVDPVEAAVKGSIKRFARLRDAQVQIGLVDQFVADRPEAKPLLQRLKWRERRLTKRLEKRLRKSKKRKLSHALSGLEQALKAADTNSKRAASQYDRIIGAINAAFGRVRTLHLHIDPQDTATIHRLRVAFKEFHYLVEALLGSLPGVTKERVQAMQTFQTRVGDIQDLDVLLRLIDKFVSKHPEQVVAMKRFGTDVFRRQNAEVRRHLAVAHELNGFWPLPTKPRAVNGRKRIPRNGTLSPQTRHRD